MESVYVIGVGMTSFGRMLNRSVKDMTTESVTMAMADAGIGTDEIEGAYFSNAAQGHMDGQHMIRGQIALRSMGIQRIPVVNVENACASASTAFNLAVAFLKSQAGDVALAVGTEKMVSNDKAHAMKSFDSAWDISTVESNRGQLLGLGASVEVPPGTMSDKPYSLFMDVYAAFARNHMHRYGTTQRQIAAVCAKNHAHSIHNPLAQIRRSFTLDEVLASPPIAYPLTLPMCSPISDGSAAAILANGRGMRRLGIDRNRKVRVLASVIQTGSNRTADQPELHCTVLAARRAYEIAGIGPSEVSVAEVHDATAMGEIIQTENLGFCKFGEGGAAGERGETTLGGRLPTNPSGGLESKGHPIGATGLGQIYEIVLQLRGDAGKRQVEGASIGLAENGGGLVGIEEAVASITLLGR